MGHSFVSVLPITDWPMGHSFVNVLPITVCLEQCSSTVNNEA